MTFVNLIGRVVSFEAKKSDQGTTYTDLRISVMRPYKNYQGHYETDYFRVTLFDSLHKKAQDYLYKGMGIALKGRLETSQWIDDHEQNRTSINIICERLIFLPKEGEDFTANINEA